MKVITDERCADYGVPGHPERPERISATLRLLKTRPELEMEWLQPPEISDTLALRAHSQAHLERLSQSYAFDADTPAYPGIEKHARRAAGGAVLALDQALAGENVFSLLRPPGHHAARDDAMGFCYLNSIAIAALEAKDRGLERIAVFDFDVHHGNGTEDILLDQSGLFYFSVHQFPAYPGTGQRHRKNASNYPVPPGSSRDFYVSRLQEALDNLRKVEPDLVAVSAGFDAYREDPLSDAPLEEEDFHWLGESVRSFGVPVFSILEGGYSDQLPNLILAYLRGLEGRPGEGER
jgi:acetoin utilization deacetylase AcuC-like enzyme